MIIKFRNFLNFIEKIGETYNFQEKFNNNFQETRNLTDVKHRKQKMYVILFTYFKTIRLKTTPIHR